MSLFGAFKETKEDQLKNTMKEFKDELKDLKNILNKIKELELSREQVQQKSRESIPRENK